jgi:hypothetical protein
MRTQTTEKSSVKVIRFRCLPSARTTIHKTTEPPATDVQYQRVLVEATFSGRTDENFGAAVSEPPRYLMRLQSLKGWSHEED